MKTFACLFLLAGSALLSAVGCFPTGKCAEAIDYAEICGVPNLELEDDLAGCGAQWECRSDCVLKAPCAEVKKSFGMGTDRTTAAWTCFEACGIGKE